MRGASFLAKPNYPHIAPPHGITFDFDDRGSPSLVYPFYTSGDLMSYLQAIPQANRLELVRNWLTYESIVFTDSIDSPGGVRISLSPAWILQ